MIRSIEWAAGLFEGEGSAGVYTYPHLRGHGTRGKMSLAMVDESPVREFARIVGVGRIHTQTKPNGKTEWRWQAQARQDVLTAAEALLPWLHSRRAERVKEVLTWAKASSPSSPGAPIAPTS